MGAAVVLVEGPSDAGVLEVLARRLGLDSPGEREGELGQLRTFQNQPYQRSRSLHEQLHRFAGTKSGRKVRLAAALAEELLLDALPAPLRDLLTYATPTG